MHVIDYRHAVFGMGACRLYAACLVMKAGLELSGTSGVRRVPGPRRGRGGGATHMSRLSSVLRYNFRDGEVTFF